METNKRPRNENDESNAAPVAKHQRKARIFRSLDDRLSLVFAVEKLGKNWQKVLHTLQNSQHRPLFTDLSVETDYSKLNGIYQSIVKTLSNEEYKWPKVTICILYLSCS